MGFPRQEYYSGLLFPSPENLPNAVIELRSPALQVVSWIAGRFITNRATREGGNLSCALKKNRKNNFFGDPLVRDLPAHTGDMGLIPGPERRHMSRDY